MVRKATVKSIAKASPRPSAPVTSQARVLSGRDSLIPPTLPENLRL
jgi:hypothetical protein